MGVRVNKVDAYNIDQKEIKPLPAKQIIKTRILRPDEQIETGKEPQVVEDLPRNPIGEIDFRREAIFVEEMQGHPPSVYEHQYKLGTKIIKELYMVQDEVQGVLLQNLLSDPEFTKFSKSDLFHLIIALTEDVQELQQKGIVHNDLHSGNWIYSSQKNKNQFIDFGQSYKIGEKNLQTATTQNITELEDLLEEICKRYAVKNELTNEILSLFQNHEEKTKPNFLQKVITQLYELKEKVCAQEKSDSNILGKYTELLSNVGEGARKSPFNKKV